MVLICVPFGCLFFVCSLPTPHTHINKTYSQQLLQPCSPFWSGQDRNHRCAKVTRHARTAFADVLQIICNTEWFSCHEKSPDICYKFFRCVINLNFVEVVIHRKFWKIQFNRETNWWLWHGFNLHIHFGFKSVTI